MAARCRSCGYTLEIGGACLACGAAEAERLRVEKATLEERVRALEGALKACKFTQHCQGCDQARAVIQEKA